MVEIKRILCPIDFSEHSRRALEHALAIARWYGSDVAVLHVAFAVPLALGPEPPVPAEPTAAQRQRLTAEIPRFVQAAQPGTVRVATVLREGANVAAVIRHEADALHADLLTIGTHGRSGINHLLLGSVAEKVLRTAVCPVLTVPRSASEPAPAAPIAYKRILCPVDFSDSSMQALQYALSLAQEADAHLTVLHVMTYDLETEAPEMYETVVADRRLTVEAYREKCEAYSRERLDAAIPRSAREFSTLDTKLAAGKAYREILRIAGDQQMDLIVMGVRGRGAVDRLIFGSTTQHVVRQATCPVLTLRNQ
jgi:nucleotide-binding universal stress UspA family protein